MKKLLLLAALACALPARADERQDAEFLKTLVETQSFQLGRPKGVVVAHDGKQVFFLRSDARSPVSSLYAFDVATREVREVLSASSLGGGEKMSPEEKARRERMRIRGRGLTAFQLSEDGKVLLVPHGGKVWLANATGDPAPRAVVSPDAKEEIPFDPKLSPDGKWVSFVRGGELWIAPTGGGAPRQLTRGATGTLIHAQAEFVAQEEMRRFTGYWWSPDSKQLAYESYDSSAVERLHLADPARPFVAPRPSEYPRAGTTNVNADLGVVGIAGGKTTWITWDEARYPYLVRVQWGKGGPFTIDVMTRDQREQALLRVEPRTGKTTPLLVEKDEVFLNVPNGYQWLDDGSGFVWATERDGAWGIELHDSAGKRVRKLAPMGDEDGLIHLDSKARVAVVRGSSSPVDDQLVEVPLDGAPPRVVAQGQVALSAIYGRDVPVSVRTTSRLDAWALTEVIGADGKSLGQLPRVGAAPPQLPRVELKEVKSGADTFFTAVLRPRDWDAKKKYPVLVEVYGGPSKQMVTRSAESYVFEQWIADHGFCVVYIDAKGTPGRGRAWERAIYGRFFEVPLDGQVRALQALGTADPSLDLKRVGITGHSFGGYMAALAVMRRPDVFAAAVASGPVADWMDYDTFYTERYLGVPTDDATKAIYAQNGLPKYAAGLTRPLLIVHGTADDNVLFAHSLELADALLAAGKPFELLPLVGQTHMFVDPAKQLAYWRRVFGFFRQHLGAL